MVRSRPFLNGTILFSSISPDYETNLKEELFGCFKYIGIPFETLDKMPIRDRKYYIIKHNEYVERENAKYNEGGSIQGEALDAYTDMEQQKSQNIFNRQ